MVIVALSSDNKFVGVLVFLSLQSLLEVDKLSAIFVVHICNALQTRCIVLRTVKSGKCQKCIKNTDDLDKMWMVPENYARNKTIREFSPIGPARCNVLCVDEKQKDRVDGPPIGMLSMKYRY